MSMEHIETIELSSSASSITFSSIPQDYTDLMLKVSARSTRTTSDADGLNIKPNNTSMTSTVRFIGNGSNFYSDTANDQGILPSVNVTANTFNNTSTYIANYTSTNNKTLISENIMENNATLGYQSFHSSVQTSSVAITSLVLTAGVGNLEAGSTFSLYGITAGSDGSTTVS